MILPIVLTLLIWLSSILLILIPSITNITNISSKLKIIGILLLTALIINEIRFTYQNDTLHNQMKENRDRHILDPTNIENIKFPYTEALNYFNLISPELLNLCLNPLLGYRSLKNCTDFEIRYLMRNIITLGRDINSCGESTTYIADYLDDLLRIIRAKIPFETYLESQILGGNGYDFWEAYPRYQSFFPSSLCNVILSVMENAILVKSTLLDNVQSRIKMIKHPRNPDLPILIRGDPKTVSGDKLIIFWHGVSCSIHSIMDTISNIPDEFAIIVPLLTPQWFNGVYSETSYQITVHNYWADIYDFLIENNILRFGICGWSCGVLMMHGFVKYITHRNLNSDLDINPDRKINIICQIVIEPFMTLPALCFGYSSSYVDFDLLHNECQNRSNQKESMMAYLFSLFMRYITVSRIFWVLPPMRNMFWGIFNTDVPTDIKTLLLLSRNDPLTSPDCINTVDKKLNNFELLYYPNADLRMIDGFHGSWPSHPDFPDTISTFMKKLI